MAGFCTKLGIRPQQMLAAMEKVADSYGVDLLAPLDTPLITQEEWSAQVEAVLRADEAVEVDLSDFPARWFEGRTANEPWVGHLRRLSARGVFVGLMSNMVPAWDAHWRRVVAPEGLFKDLVMSFEVGSRKPEPGIFRVAEERTGFQPHECVLVDDIEKNCAGAREAGWHAIHYTDPARAIAELDALLGASRPE
ncbi:HAD-IA family hydrolase [Streptomyces sp. NPDC004232]|uniref:HAD-IA family hydrolase n=1 Tax=Streptomyces sp. NPDC004232 TaxID=3154454 RepID=UPI001DF2EF3F|nr:HAD-IA family hydrolase [Streptomyces sp. tea 10]